MSQKKRTWSKSCHVVRECCLGVGSSWARPARDHPGAVAGSRRSAGHLVGVGGHFSWPVAFLTEAGFRNYRTRSVGGMRRLQDGRLHQPPDWLFRDDTRHQDTAHAPEFELSQRGRAGGGPRSPWAGAQGSPSGRAWTFASADCPTGVPSPTQDGGHNGTVRSLTHRRCIQIALKSFYEVQIRQLVNGVMSACSRLSVILESHAERHAACRSSRTNCRGYILSFSSGPTWRSVFSTIEITSF